MGRGGGGRGPQQGVMILGVILMGDHGESSLETLLPCGAAELLDPSRPVIALPLPGLISTKFGTQSNG
jgi:hypothetical protein